MSLHQRCHFTDDRQTLLTVRCPDGAPLPEDRQGEGDFLIRVFSLELPLGREPRFLPGFYGEPVSVPNKQVAEIIEGAERCFCVSPHYAVQIRVHTEQKGAGIRLSLASDAAGINLSRLYVEDADGNRLLLATGGSVCRGMSWYLDRARKLSAHESCAGVVEIMQV